MDDLVGKYYSPCPLLDHFCFIIAPRCIVPQRTFYIGFLLSCHKVQIKRGFTTIQGAVGGGVGGATIVFLLPVSVFRLSCGLIFCLRPPSALAFPGLCAPLEFPCSWCRIGTAVAPLGIGGSLPPYLFRNDIYPDFRPKFGSAMFVSLFQ